MRQPAATAPSFVQRRSHRCGGSTPCLAAVPRLAPAQRLAWRSARPGGGGTPRPVAGHGLPGGMDGTPRSWTEALRCGMDGTLRLRQYTSPGSGGTPRPAVAMPRLARQQRRYASPGCGDRPSPAPTGSAHWRIARRQRHALPGGGSTPRQAAAVQRLAWRWRQRLAWRQCHGSPGSEPRTAGPRRSESVQDRARRQQADWESPAAVTVITSRVL